MSQGQYTPPGAAYSTAPSVASTAAAADVGTRTSAAAADVGASTSAAALLLNRCTRTAAAAAAAYP